MRIAVTGASGFVGGAVATALVERGHSVTGYGRRAEGWAGDYEQWDLTCGPRVLEVDAVVHAAALADDWVPRGEAMAANLLGTRHVVASAQGARIVHISTSSVYDAFAPSLRVREDAPPATRFLSAYSESKAAAELELAGADAVILRPHAVYGPGDTTLLPRILQGIRGGRLRLPEGAGVAHTLTHVGNLVDAVAASLAGRPGVYNIGDDGDVLLADVLREFLDRRGRRDVVLTSVPYRVAFAAAAALEGVHRAVGGRPPITRYAVSQLGLERTLDLTAARERLEYRPHATTLAGAERW